ncbi:MAG: MFS transporter [Chloroflexota bacterium]|nr:MAG: MFS transporter [Chloroflexota bacterium]
MPFRAGRPATLRGMERSLRAVLIGTFTLRFSTGLTGAMLAFYLADLATAGTSGIDGKVVGALSAMFFLAELVLSPVFGVLADRIGHHRVMLFGPAFGAIAVVLTAFTTHVGVLAGTRILEGASTAASVPAILGFIALATAGDEVLRGKASARFEGATLAGLGAGFIVAPLLFKAIGPNAFLLNAVVYVGSFLIYRYGVADTDGAPAARRARDPGLGRYLALIRNSHVLLLAPTWIAVNASIGLWFSQSLFQFSRHNPAFPNQWLLQGFSAEQITFGAVVIAVIFGAGILWWGNRFDRFRRTTIILFGVLGGLGLVAAGLVVNHAGFGARESGIVAVAVALAAIGFAAGLFLLAGATPAAVGLLADVSEQFPADRGAIMGLYSVFLAIGQIGGSLIGGVVADGLGMDGLLLATGGLLLLALVPLTRLRGMEHYFGPGAPVVLGEGE